MRATVELFNARTGRHAHHVGEVFQVSDGAYTPAEYWTVVPDGVDGWVAEPVIGYKVASAWVDNSGFSGRSPEQARALAQELADKLVEAYDYDSAVRAFRAWHIMTSWELAQLL